MTGPLTRSPPTTPAPHSRQASPSPATIPSTQAMGVVPGMASPTVRAVGQAPIAATSARFWAAARRPTCCGVDQSVRKCEPSTSTSVLTA